MRRQADGETRASALAVRTAAIRRALAAHWRLADRLGGHAPTFGEVVAAGRVLGIGDDILEAAVEDLEWGNWARHAAPPRAAKLRPVPLEAISVADVERKLLMADGGARLDAGAAPFQPRRPPGVWEAPVQQREDVLLEALGVTPRVEECEQHAPERSLTAELGETVQEASPPFLFFGGSAQELEEKNVEELESEDAAGKSDWLAPGVWQAENPEAEVQAFTGGFAAGWRLGELAALEAERADEDAQLESMARLEDAWELVKARNEALEEQLAGRRRAIAAIIDGELGTGTAVAVAGDAERDVRGGLGEGIEEDEGRTASSTTCTAAPRTSARGAAVATYLEEFPSALLRGGGEGEVPQETEEKEGILERHEMVELEAQGVEGSAAPEGNSTDEPKERCLLTGEVLQGPRWTPTDLPHDPGEGLLFGDPDMRGRRRRAGKSKSAVP